MDVSAWLREYARAWESGDGGVVELFTDDATYRSHVFQEPHRGRDGIAGYWRSATETQRGTRVVMGDPLVEGGRVVAEWWTTMDEEDGPVTLPGVLLLDFEGERCRALREYWAHATGTHEPFDGWGEVAPGQGATVHAATWAKRYAAAWLDGHPDAAAALYSDEVVYRSHPFREPHRGRAGVRDYSAAAYAAESERAVRFGDPVAAGSSAAVEYWTTFTEDEAPKTLAGCALLAFDERGLCTSSREYWHLEEGHVDPPPEWGWAG